MLDLVLPFSASTLLQLAEINKGKDVWSGSVTFNASAATGNTQNSVLGGRFDISRKMGAFTHAFDAGGNYTEVTRERDGNNVRDITQNRWFAQYRAEVQADERSFFYGRTRYDEDQFSGFDRQFFIGGGFGHSFFDDQKKKLTALLGPGIQYLERARPQQQPDDFDARETVFALFVGETYRHVLRENVSIEQSLDATLSETNNSVSNRMSLKTDLTDKISSRISYAFTHNTDPPDGRKNTDTLLSASIGYQF